MKNLLQTKLENIGLSNNEISVYLALLELGETTILQIASKSGVKRTTVYITINSLKKKGLVHELKKRKKAFFYAEDPRILQERIKEKKNAIDEAIPQLLAMANFIDKKPKITFYEGAEGIKDIYRDTLNYSDKKMFSWLSDNAFKILGQEFTEYYIKERSKKTQPAHVIAPNNETMRKFQKKDTESLRETRLTSSEKAIFEVEINLYGNNKIGIMSFEEKIGVIIESPKIFTTLKSIFEIMWEGLE